MLENYPTPRPKQTIQGNVSLRTNLIKVKSIPKLVHYYTVTIDPAPLRSNVFATFQRMFQSTSPYAFDGVNILVTLTKLKDLVFESENGPYKKRLELSYNKSFALEKLLHPSGDNISTEVQILEVICRYFQHCNFVGESRFAYNNKGLVDLGKSVQVWTGISQSLRPTKLGLLNNIDLCFDFFHESVNLIDLLKLIFQGDKKTETRGGGPGNYRPNQGQGGGRPHNDNRGGGQGERRPFQGNRGGNDQRDQRDNNNSNRRYRREGGDPGHNDKDNLVERMERLGGNYGEKEVDVNKLTFKEKEFCFGQMGALIKKLKLVSTHLPSRTITFKGEGLSDKAANEIFFESDGEKFSVAQYFAKTYKPLKYPNFPCVIRKRKGGDPCYFPLEVLMIAPNQKSSKNNTEQYKQQLIKIAAKPPIKRFDAIKGKLADLNILSNSTLKAFNVEYDSKFIEVKGRVLNPPGLEYNMKNRSGHVIPSKGSWNCKNLTALEPVTIKKWTFAYLSGVRMNKNSIGGMISNFVKLIGTFGIQMSEKYDILEMKGPDVFSDYIKTNQTEFILVILENKAFDAYKEIKWRSETDGVGVVTQCILQSNLRKFEDYTFVANIALKINIKMKGLNWKLQDKFNVILDQPTAVFGADVTHPTGNDFESPSISAVTCSLDKYLGKFTTEISLQEQRREIIGNLEFIITKQLNQFEKLNKLKPKRIIFFRDGVGESQFFEVYQTEIQAIQQACAKLEKGYAPKITYIIAQKRHSIRFELMNPPRDPRGKEATGNVTPGTVVDDIGHPVYYDFYMVTHYALQGSARPVRYHILYDENNFGSKIYEIINNMCYIFPRATKSVSVVPAVYYAHLAASRARCYLTNEKKLRNVFQGLNNHLYYL